MATPRLLGVGRDDDVFRYLQRLGQGSELFKYILGAANPFKEGDLAVGVAATGELDRRLARQLLSRTTLGALSRQPPFVDKLSRFIEGSLQPSARASLASWTLQELKIFVLTQDGGSIAAIMPGLASDVIAALVKILSNDELVAVSAKVFNPLPGTQLGAAGYLGARVQPNSPTDCPEDVRWQVFNSFAFAVGDLMLGTNPVDSRVDNIQRLERTLRDIVESFSLQEVLPWCVLAHADVQARIMEQVPEDVALMFQSLGGNDAVNQTFGISVDKMLDYNARKNGPFGFYYETGQGADFTNGAAFGTDMVVHEARKYGFARALKQAAGHEWTVVNDVAGFIGPEVFRNREQLVRACLEDLVMGKLHGLCMGHDICTTLHMDVSLADLDWCLEAMMPANPAFLMALPCKNDPMLSYLTTSFQDHVRLRQKFGYKVADGMWDFFRRIEIIDGEGNFTAHVGDPAWVYFQYRRAQGDGRSQTAIYAEGVQQMRAVQQRGVVLACGFGATVADLQPQLAQDTQQLFDDAKVCLWTELDPAFVASLPEPLALHTTASNRMQYVMYPASGEALTATATAALEELRQSWGAHPPDVQILVSDGLNAQALMDPLHLGPFLARLKDLLQISAKSLSPVTLTLTGGRVRAGYAAGQLLFSRGLGQRSCSLVHIIGERPGTRHHNYSVYTATLSPADWAAGRCDHDVVQVVSGISDTALQPVLAAAMVVEMIESRSDRGLVEPMQQRSATQGDA